MSFETIAKNYLAELQSQAIAAESSGQLTAELSHRPALHTFFRNMAESIDIDIEVVHEPRNQFRMGRPDWRFHHAKSFGVYGYAEAKGLDIAAEISVEDHAEQIARYLGLGHRVILTDGLEFIFYDSPNVPPRRLSLVAKPVMSSNWATLQPNGLLEAAFRDYFQTPRARRCSEEELIREVAKRAKELSKSVRDLADVPPGAGLDENENRTIEALRDLKSVVEQHHDPRLQDPRVFGDFVAQVLIFGLLYAHRVVHGPDDVPADRYRKIRQFWSDVVYREFTEHLRPFQALVSMLESELETLGTLGTWYQDCCYLLAYIQLVEEQREYPDYHKLYEQFLAVFDPQTRFDYGAFYTPRELAEFSVGLTRAIVDSQLEGLSLYETGNKLIDPCCGTATFLEQLLVQSGHSHLPRIIGFEILPAPYALAHYRLSMLTDQGYPQNVSIVLTNTLSDELEQEYDLTACSNLIEEEQAVARECSTPPLTLVIGNPPSSDSSVQTMTENLSIIQELVEDFRPPPEERTGRQNIQKQLQNEFVRFLRWTCNKLLQSKPGMFALVLPESFGDHPSYYYARKWITLHFPQLWAFDIDLDGRTGVRASSLFMTRQGRMLLIGFTGFSEDPAPAHQISYGSITQLTRQDKLETLAQERDAAAYFDMFESVSISADTCDFRPTKPFDTEVYLHYWPLYPEKQVPQMGEKYIFERHCSGLKLAPSSIFVHASKPLLIRRSREIATLTTSVQELRRRWFSGQDRPPPETKFSETVRETIGRVLSNEGEAAIVDYAYRPFTVIPALISESVLQELATTGGGGTRYRPEVLSAFKAEETIGFAVAPAPKDVGDALHRFVSFCWNLPDNDLAKRGNAHVFCNQFPEYKKPRRDWNPQPVDNISPELLDKLAGIGPISSSDIVFYTYAVLCSDAFLDAFEGALFTVADPRKRPRIPIPANAGLLRSIAAKGKRLAELEKSPNEIELPQEFAEMEALFREPFKLTGYTLNEREESIELYENGSLVICMRPVPTDVLEFAVSGYQVLQQWLKLHSYRYTRAQFTLEQYTNLLKLVHQVQEQISIVSDLDDEMSQILSGNAMLVSAA